MATTPYPFPFPSAATYPTPIFPGGCYTAPLPFFYSATSTPAFPYAATYPCQPSASSYAPPPTFFPAPAYGSSTVPAAANPYPPDFGSFHFESPFLTHEMGTNVLSTVNTNINHPSFMEGDAAVQAVTDERVQTKDDIHHGLQREFLNVQGRLNQEQAHDLTFFDTFQGELVKLKLRVSHFAVSLGKQPISADTSKPELSQRISIVPAAPDHVAPQVFAEIPTPSLSQRTHGSALDYCSGHTNLVQSSCLSSLSEQNLNESSQQYDFHNLSRKTVLLSDGSEHSYFALPEIYPLERAVPEPVFDVCDEETKDCSNGFGDVFTSSVEQPAMSFHKVPESASSEQVPKCLSKPPETEETSKYLRKAHENKTHSSHSSHSPMSAIATDLMQFQAFERVPVFDVYGDETEDCSNAFVDVSASTPEQQSYAEDQREADQPPKCFSRPNFSPERPIVGTVGLFSLANEQSTGELDTLNESNKLLFENQNIEQLLICSSTAPQCSTYEEESQGNKKILWEKPVCQTATGHSISILPWDPGATSFPVLFLTVVEATKLQCTLLLNFTNYTWDPGVSELKDTVLDNCAVQVHFLQPSTELSLFGLEFSTSSQKSVQWDPGVKVSVYCWLNILTAWSETDKPLSCTHSPEAWPNQSVSSDPSYIWDPGTMLVWYKSKWWLLFTKQNINWHNDIKRYGVDRWLIHFQPP